MRKRKNVIYDYIDLARAFYIEDPETLTEGEIERRIQRRLFKDTPAGISGRFLNAPNYREVRQRWHLRFVVVPYNNELLVHAIKLGGAWDGDGDWHVPTSEPQLPQSVLDLCELTVVPHTMLRFSDAVTLDLLRSVPADPTFKAHRICLHARQGGYTLSLSVTQAVPTGTQERGIGFSSIVEGVEQTVEEHELYFPFHLQDMWDAINEVNAAAEDIWQETHGCAWCQDDGDEEAWQVGETPVNPECTHCKGQGAVI